MIGERIADWMRNSVGPYRPLCGLLSYIWPSTLVTSVLMVEPVAW